MKNFHKSYLVFLFLLLISFFLKVKPISCLSRIKIGDTVSDFTALDLNNNKVQFSYYLNNKDNKLITLLFWNVQPDSTLRNYSEEEMVIMQKVYNWYHAYGFEIIGVYCPWGDETPSPEEIAKMKEALKKLNITFPVLIDNGLKIYNKFGVSAFPSFILIDVNKISRYQLPGYAPQSADKIIKHEVENLLALTNDQKVIENKPIYTFEKEDVGQFRTKFISEKLWGEKLVLNFYGRAGETGLNNPTSFAIGENGNIYIVDSLNGIINVYDMNGKFLFNFGQEGFAGENLALPWGIEIDYKGRVYITDIGKNLIFIYTPEGKFMLKFGGTGSNDGQFNMPFDIAIDRNKNIYIADSKNDRIQIINGSFKKKIGSSGSRDGEFSLPTAIALSNDEQLIYILDTNNCRVQIFDKKGNFVSKFGRPGSKQGEFNHPEGISVDIDGKIFISDTLNNRIQIFDKNGKFLGMFGHYGSDEGDLNSPGKSFIDIKGRFYVVDRKNNRIQGFSIKYIKTFLL